MAGFRFPGPFGVQSAGESGFGVWRSDSGVFHGCIYAPVSDRGPFGISSETTSGGGQPAAATASASKAADEDELALLEDVYGVLSRGGKSYKKKDPKKKKKLIPDVDAYIADRNGYFGGVLAWREYKKIAAADLDANKEKLRRVIEPPKAVRNRKPRWKEAQTIFYAWVRKSYEGKVPAGTDIPKMILAGMSDKLKKALDKVRLDYGKAFQAGGFNPRPQKLQGRYRLGTLSEHALGNAIDIDAKKNAQITSAQWRAIEKYTGKSLDHSSRKTKWKSAPKEVYDGVKAINDEFVKKLAADIKAAEAAHKKAQEEAATKEATKAATKAVPGAAKPPATKPASPPAFNAIAEIVGKDANLKVLGAGFVTNWSGGFMALTWELVKELHEEGFTWGVAFGDPDIHHFEL